MSQMSHLLENWLGRGFAWCGALLLVAAVAGCNPPVDEPDPATPKVTDESPVTSEADPTEEMPSEVTPATDGATAEAPNADPAETATDDPLNTTDNSPGVKLGEPEDPVNFKE